MGIEFKLNNKNYFNNLVRILPLLGVSAGLLFGCVHRYLNGIDGHAKAYCKGYSEFLLPSINSIKQWEYIHSPFLTPGLIFLFNIGYDYFTQKGEKQSLKKAIKRQFTIRQATLFGITVVLAYLKKLYAPLIGLEIPEKKLPRKPGEFYLSSGFDASGHVLKKGIAGFVMGHLFSHSESKKVALLASAIYAATEGVLLYNTSYYCHTYSEMAVGALQGFTILGIGSLASSMIK